MIKLTDVDENDNENKATVVVALMQKDSRLKRTNLKKDSAEEFIQFKLFKVISTKEKKQTEIEAFKIKKRPILIKFFI